MLTTGTKRYLLKPIIKITTYYHSTQLEDQLHTSGWMSADHNTTCLFSSLIIDKSCFFSTLFWRVERRPRQLQPMRPNLHSKLVASQSFSRKITRRYLLKLETNHTNHNIPSFDAAETRQQMPGGLLPWISFG